MRSPLLLSVVAITPLILSACQPTTPSDDITTIYSTTTILGSVVGDIVSCVGDEAVVATSLMPIGADPHDFAPSSEQMARMSESGIVVANGLGLEGGLGDALDQVEADGGVVFHVAEWVDPLPFADDDYAGEEVDDHGHGSFDPHFWFDMGRMAEVARQLGVELEPQLGPDSVSCGEGVAESILATETEVIEILSDVPTANRVLVTDHQAFNYFAERYGFQIAGVVIPGGSTLAEPSSSELAALVATVEERGIPALIGNYYEQSDLLAAVAEESGQLRVVPLYVGSLGDEDSNAHSYESMMVTNARLLAEALS